MDFFEHQEIAQRKTKALVFYFVVAVLLIMVSVYLLIALVLLRPRQDQWSPLVWMWNPQVFLYTSSGTALVIMIGSLAKRLELRGGGKEVASLLGGQPLNVASKDLADQRLRNVVEEMAIASGTAVPEIYILEEEKGINAFAAGYSPKDAVIGVTRGGARMLNREELQGVIAHEFSHILNGDMRLNLRLIAVLQGILCLALIGRGILSTAGRSSGRKKKGNGGSFIIGLGLLAIGGIGVFFGRLIKSAVSRQREFLADAAAVQFTRNPSGLASALKKIGGLAYGSGLRSSKAEEASHLFFAHGLAASSWALEDDADEDARAEAGSKPAAPSWFTWMQTHPPLGERIRRIDPAFDGVFPAVRALADQPLVPPDLSSPSPTRANAPAANRVLGLAARSERVVPERIQSKEVISQVGALTGSHLEYAAALRGSFPEAIWQAAHELLGATALIYAVLLSREEPTRQTQLSMLERNTDTGAIREMRRLLPRIDALQPGARLPLVDLTLSALRGLSAPQYAQFKANLKELIESDRSIDLFEYALQKIVTRHLDPQFQPVRRAVVQYYSIRGVQDACSVLLSGLAHLGHRDAGARGAAFQCGLTAFPSADVDCAFVDFDKANLPQMDQALDQLSQASPLIKKLVLDACARTVASDGILEPKEAELLRAIADTLDCPLPPFLGEP